MAKWENFTAERVAGFKCEPGKQQSIYWDGKAPGLGLRVTAAGAKSYIFETRMHGKTLRLTIGDPRTWAIGKARDEATRLKSMTDRSIDPRQVEAEKAERAQAERTKAKRQSLLAAEAWAVYVEARRLKWSARHLADHAAIAAASEQMDTVVRSPLEAVEEALHIEEFKTGAETRENLGADLRKAVSVAVLETPDVRGGGDVGNGVGDRCADIADDDVGTLTGQSNRIGATLAAGGPGDECDATIQSALRCCHQRSSRLPRIRLASAGSQLGHRERAPNRIRKADRASW